MENFCLGLILEVSGNKTFFFSRLGKNKQMIESSRDGSETLSFSSSFLPGPSKCEVERYAAQRYQHAYIPSCDTDGGYTAVQCQQGGQCWCVDTKGQEVQGTKRRGQPPACGMFGKGENASRQHGLVHPCMLSVPTGPTHLPLPNSSSTVGILCTIKKNERTNSLLRSDRLWCS